ncbi:Hypothetical protein FKW44_001998 [Caligus rogercresseyi]|uniref:Uncharacterized protein n=1 Tax=Caligus rogercresseyi TaxID=217165 RepID=A0A7T8KJL1_CALRO|nr:Hypothetical protein FKW44_001998 [Caligus rogercresseyi]
MPGASKDSKKTTGVDKEQRPTKKQRTGTAKKCPHYSTGRIEDLKAKALTDIIVILKPGMDN